MKIQEFLSNGKEHFPNGTKVFVPSTGYGVVVGETQQAILINVKGEIVQCVYWALQRNWNE
jgi:hypothetical protein